MCSIYLMAAYVDGLKTVSNDFWGVLTLAEQKEESFYVFFFLLLLFKTELGTFFSTVHNNYCACIYTCVESKRGKIRLCSRNIWTLCWGTRFNENYWWWLDGWTGWSCGSFPILVILWFFQKLLWELLVLRDPKTAASCSFALKSRSKNVYSVQVTNTESLWY